MTRDEEEARLEQAMQRGDELLVNSLRDAAMASATAGPPARTIASTPAPATQPTHDWPPTLASLSDDNWRRAFAVGGELARMDPPTSWPILQANWAKIP